MNPFTESTVARPLSEGAQSQNAAQSNTSPQSGVDTSTNVSAETVESSGATHSVRPAFFQVLGGRLKACAVGVVSAKVLLVLGLGLAASGLAYALDVNLATEDQLRTVRGIGPKTAQLIVEERTRGGKYESFDDFSERVKGIGPKKSASLQASGLTVSGAPSDARMTGSAVAGSSGPTRAAPASSARAGSPATK